MVENGQVLGILELVLAQPILMDLEVEVHHEMGRQLLQNWTVPRI